MPRRANKPRRLVADGRVYMWTLRHSHRRDGDSRAVDCRQTLGTRERPELFALLGDPHGGRAGRAAEAGRVARGAG
ncbi:hypothetical protein [Streptomyces sp. NPDC091371]|uniref:hypothetical protein n=1 Tax=Streptomyces sp. NPDC091371 TaxID=3155303 RepID=UPI00343C2241